ncbi:MAG: response regulator [Kiritimatiellae bacterium]|nr:response regulator [Kiritimatiellia bacterium]
MARILIVDDEEPVVQTERMLFKAEGHEVVALSKSDAAADLLRSKEPFDLLVTDIRMQPVDGLQLIKLAREVRPGMGVIVISAYCSEEAVKKAMDVGCGAYIKKPFKVDEVLCAVRGALDGK